MIFAPQHLSDEAIAACADSALNTPSRLRAERHLAGCAQCREAVDAQREAAASLRRSEVPALPSALLQRLRDLPQTTDLPPRDFGLSPEGFAVFPAYRPPTRRGPRASPPPAPPAEFRATPAGPFSVAVATHRLSRPTRAVLVAAAALATMGGAGVAVRSVPGQSLPEAPVPSIEMRFIPTPVVGPAGQVPTADVIRPATSVHI